MNHHIFLSITSLSGQLSLNSILQSEIQHQADVFNGYVKVL